MEDKNQSKETPQSFLTKTLGEERRCRGCGGEPIETVQDSEDKQTRWLGHIRQNEKRRSPKNIGCREHFPRVDPVYQPSRECRPHEARSTHDADRRRGGHLRNTSFDRVRDQVCADETVGGHATDKKTAA